MSLDGTGRRCCGAARSASLRVSREMVTPICTRSSAATAAIIRTWTTARSLPNCRRSADLTRSRQAWPPTKGTSNCILPTDRSSPDARTVMVVTGSSGKSRRPPHRRGAPRPDTMPYVPAGGYRSGGQRARRAGGQQAGTGAGHRHRPHREVAERLYVSPRTLSGHLRHAFGKLNISSRVALTRIAAQHAELP
jgi:Bacterial regulatory proteins, luxR family